MEVDLYFYRNDGDIRNLFCENDKDLYSFYTKEIYESDYYLVRFTAEGYFVCQSSDLYSYIVSLTNNYSGIGIKCISEKEYKMFNLITEM